MVKTEFLLTQTIPINKNIDSFIYLSLPYLKKKKKKTSKLSQWEVQQIQGIQ